MHRWGATADGVLIEFTLQRHGGGRPISWDAVDRFVLGEDGLATERVTYFDSAPIVLTVAAPPARLAGVPAAPSCAADPCGRRQSSRPTWRRIETESE